MVELNRNKLLNVEAYSTCFRVFSRTLSINVLVSSGVRLSTSCWTFHFLSLLTSASCHRFLFAGRGFSAPYPTWPSPLQSPPPLSLCHHPFLFYINQCQQTFTLTFTFRPFSRRFYPRGLTTVHTCWSIHTHIHPFIYTFTQSYTHSHTRSPIHTKVQTITHS